MLLLLLLVVLVVVMMMVKKKYIFKSLDAGCSEADHGVVAV